MDDLVSMLPTMHSALEAIEVEDRRALVRSFIEFIKETSEQLNKYASKPTWCECGWIVITSAEVSHLAT